MRFGLVIKAELYIEIMYFKLCVVHVIELVSELVLGLFHVDFVHGAGDSLEAAFVENDLLKPPPRRVLDFFDVGQL